MRVEDGPWFGSKGIRFTKLTSSQPTATRHPTRRRPACGALDHRTPLRSSGKQQVDFYCGIDV